MSQVLSKMAIQEPDDAMQCVIRLAREEANVAGGYSDEIRYQLAKQASDAIETLSVNGAVINSYHERTAGLWREYLAKVSAPLDRTRISFGINKILQHSRFAAFDTFTPTIVGAMGKARSWLAPAAADQFFSTAKRCPRWTNTTASGTMACTPTCTNFGKAVVAELAKEFGSGSWSGSDGLQRLATNAKAFEKGLTCGQP